MRPAHDRVIHRDPPSGTDNSTKATSAFKATFDGLPPLCAFFRTFLLCLTQIVYCAIHQN